MVSFEVLIESLQSLIKSSEEVLQLAWEDESRAAMWEEELDKLSEDANYARGVLLAAGRPVK